MRFLFEYVTCCMMMSTPCTTKPSSSSSDATPALKSEEETRSLVTASTPSPRTGSGRRRKRTPTRGCSADWQPSLFAISEDTAVAVVKAVEKVQRQVAAAAPVKRQPSSSQRNVKRCGGFAGRVDGRSRSYDFSRDPIPMVVPAFSAAPFMF